MKIKSANNTASDIEQIALMRFSEIELIWMEGWEGDNCQCQNISGLIKIDALAFRDLRTF